MQTFIIEEKCVGYADITIEAENEEEAIDLYNKGHYLDSNYVIDDVEEEVFADTQLSLEGVF